MAEITVIEDPEAEFAEFVVVGTVSANDIIAIAQDHPGFRMRKHLVDMTRTDFHLLDSPELTQIATAFRELESDRTGGRTAVVVSSEVHKIIPNLFSLISSQSAGRPEQFKITLSRDEALSWLSAHYTSEQK